MNLLLILRLSKLVAIPNLRTDQRQCQRQDPQIVQRRNHQSERYAFIPLMFFFTLSFCIDCRMNVEEYEEEILQSLRKGDSTNGALQEIAEQFIETMERMFEFESSEDDFGNWGEDDSYDDSFF